MLGLNKFNLKAWSGSLAAGLSLLILSAFTEGFGVAEADVAWVPAAVTTVVTYVIVWVVGNEPPGKS